MRSSRPSPPDHAADISSDPTPLTVEHDGLTIAALDWGGDGMPLLLLHPNGFPAGVFDPMARRLTDTFRPIGVDLRGHGGTDVPTVSPEGYGYGLMASDVLAVLDHLGVGEFVALGESLGGGVCTFIDEQRPAAMRRLMLCEAIAFDIDVLRQLGMPDRLADASSDNQNAMAVVARKRRAVWPDRATVRESYGGRPPLNVLAPEALDAYVRWGFVDRPDGQVELSCPPESEATIFEVGAMEIGGGWAWQRLANLRARTTVLAGVSSHLPLDWFRAQADQADAPFVEVEGTHFFLQEDTARAVDLVRRYLTG